MRVGDCSGLRSPDDGAMRDKPAGKSTGYRSIDRIEISTGTDRKIVIENDRMSAIRTRLENGVYFKPTFAGSVADRIIDSNDLEGSPLMGARKKNDNRNEDDTAGIRRDRVDEVKKDLVSGKYSDSKIVKIIADRLLDQLASKKTRNDEEA